MRSEARTKLDRIEQWEPGKGHFEAYGYLRGHPYRSGPFDFQAGGGLDYQHRISNRWSAFARGEIGYDSGSGLEFSALGGMRLRF